MTCLIICPATYAVRASWTILSKKLQRHGKYPGHSEAPRQQGHTARASVGIGAMFLPVLVVAACALELLEGISLASSHVANMPSAAMVACWTEPPAQTHQQGGAHSPAEPATPARIACVMEPATWGADSSGNGFVTCSLIQHNCPDSPTNPPTIITLFCVWLSCLAHVLDVGSITECSPCPTKSVLA